MHIIPFHKEHTVILISLYQDLRDFLVKIPERIDHPVGYDTTKELIGYVSGWEKGDILIFLAEEEGKICGFCIGSIASTDWEGTTIKSYGKLELLYVVPGYRGKGIGKSLVKNMEELFKKSGISYMEVSVLAQNMGARGLYTQFGFQENLITLGKEI